MAMELLIIIPGATYCPLVLKRDTFYVTDGSPQDAPPTRTQLRITVDLHHTEDGPETLFGLGVFGFSLLIFTLRTGGVIISKPLHHSVAPLGILYATDVLPNMPFIFKTNWSRDFFYVMRTKTFWFS